MSWDVRLKVISAVVFAMRMCLTKALIPISALQANFHTLTALPHHSRAEFASSDTSALGHIVIYGDTLDSYHAMSILERSGAAGGHERAGFYAPPSDGRDPLVGVLLQCAQRERLELPQPKAMQLTALQSIEGTSRPHAYFEVRCILRTSFWIVVSFISDFRLSVNSVSFHSFAYALPRTSNN